MWSPLTCLKAIHVNYLKPPFDAFKPQLVHATPLRKATMPWYTRFHLLCQRCLQLLNNRLLLCLLLFQLVNVIVILRV